MGRSPVIITGHVLRMPIQETPVIHGGYLAESRQGVVLQIVGWGRKLLATYRKNYNVMNSCKGPWTWILWNNLTNDKRIHSELEMSRIPAVQVI